MKNLKLFFTLTVLIYCAKLFSQESIVFDKQYLFDGRNIMGFYNISEIKTFSVKDLRNGIYIIKIKSKDRVYMGKLSVKH